MKILSEYLQDSGLGQTTIHINVFPGFIVQVCCAEIYMQDKPIL